MGNETETGTERELWKETGGLERRRGTAAEHKASESREDKGEDDLDG